MKRLAILLCALVAVAGLSMPASAGGVGSGSMYCRDGQPPQSEIPLVGWPVTLDLELYTGSPAYVQVCYSTTPAGDGTTAITGGAFWVRPEAGEADCTPDANTVLAVECFFRVSPSGIHIELIPRLQSTTVGGTVAVLPGTFDDLVCLRGFTVNVDGGPAEFGPADIGICV